MIKAKCPFCGVDFNIENNNATETTCPSCNAVMPTVRATKYYTSVYDNKEEIREAHGEDYHRVQMILAEAQDLTVDGEYEKAEERLNAALELTDSDYRVYMAFVAARTKNYTDLTDESHKEYLNKAIAVADADGKKEITRLYKNYYAKTKLSDDEMEVYSAEEVKLKKRKVENGLKSLIPDYMAKAKRNKLLAIFSPVLIVLGLGISIPFVFLDYLWVSLIGMVMLIAGYILFRTWFISRDNVRAFNSVLDLYDLIDSKQLNDDVLIRIYDHLYKIYGRFADKDPLVSISRDTVKMVSYLLSLGDDDIEKFILSDKYFADNIPADYGE